MPKKIDIVRAVHAADGKYHLQRMGYSRELPGIYAVAYPDFATASATADMVNIAYNLGRAHMRDEFRALLGLEESE